MSKILYVIYRTPNQKRIEDDKNLFLSIEKELNPKNITPNPMNLYQTINSLGGVFNPVSTIEVCGSSVCMGYSPNKKKFELGIRSEDIEGTYSIYRNTPSVFEIVTDMVGSRSVWYYADGEIFVSSSSQRAIIMYLGSFVFNKSVIPWMLTNGNIGPFYSYGTRLKLLHPNVLLRLDKYSWDVSIRENTISLSSKYRTKKEFKKDLRHSIELTFKKLNLDMNKFVLPLSGGYDSRVIFYFLKKFGLKTVTWGNQEAVEEKNNDAYVATNLAKKYGVEHSFFDSASCVEECAVVFERFFLCGEGRIDHIGGYLDAMNMWGRMFQHGVESIIRGDELLGLTADKVMVDIRASEGLLLLKDFMNIAHLNEQFSIEEQKLPIFPYKGNNKFVLKGYMAFLYEHPIIFSVLSDIKLSYVEIVNPLLSKDILYLIKEAFSKKNLGDKKLFKQIVNEYFQNYPIASKGANVSVSEWLRTEKVVSEFLKCFQTVSEEDALSPEFVSYVETKITTKRKVKTSTLSMLPLSIKK